MEEPANNLMKTFSSDSKNQKIDEEFNNFMHRVNEVDAIIKKMTSSDLEQQKMGDLEAARLLGEKDTKTTKTLENTDPEDLTLVIKSNRTVINKKAFKESDPNTMSQEAFMREVSRDADQRYQNKLVRKERMEIFKIQASKAFRRGEYEKALSLYNRAIEEIKDCCFLYNNRALTYIKLKFYDKAINDIVEWALKLNENSLRSWLLLAKAQYLSNEMQEFEEAIEQAKIRNPDQLNTIEEYIKSIKEETTSDDQ